MKCGNVCEVYSRVVGFYRPTSGWNKGKTEEFKDRTEFQEKVSLNNKLANKEF